MPGKARDSRELLRLCTVARKYTQKESAYHCGRSLDPEDPLEEEEMATHSRILAWGIPWTKEPGELQSMRSQSQTRLSTTTTKLRE